MTHDLSPRDVRAERRGRAMRGRSVLIAVIGGAVSSIAIAGCLIDAAFHRVPASAELDAMKAELAIRDRERAGLAARVVSLRAELDTIERLSNHDDFGDLIRFLAGASPERLTLRQLAVDLIESDSGSRLSVTARGNAGARESVSVLVEELQAAEPIRNVELSRLSASASGARFDVSFDVVPTAAGSRKEVDPR